MYTEIKFLAKFIFKHSFRHNLLFDQMNSGIKYLGGDKSLPKVLLIRRKNTKVGTFSDYIMFLNAVEMALRYGYIPVIDRKTIKNAFLPAADEINTWELFFEQPMDVLLDDIDYEHYQVYSFFVDFCLPVQITFSSSSISSAFWRGFAKKYLRIKQNFVAEFEINKNILFNGKRVLGVAIREGYNKLEEMKSKYNFNHPRQFDAETMIKYVKIYLEKWNCERVFFTCQTKETVTLFQKYFGENAVCTTRNRPSYTDLLEGDDLELKDYTEAVENEKSYIEEIYLLSQCNCLLCNQNSGVDAAIIMSSGYDRMLCIENGLYT